MRRSGALLVVLGLAVAACSGGPATDPGSAPVTTTSSSGAVTVPQSATTTSPTTPISSPSPSSSSSTTTTTAITLPPTPQTAAEAGLPWWNDRVFYEVFVRSFHDSDGDGVGDLRGLIERLDYLNDGDPSTGSDLGVTGLWLMPVFESPSYHGYDVVDYRSIEQDYGTLADFRDLLEAAHERGIAVIVDLVINHSSRDHEWFQASRDPASDFADWYVWADHPPGWVGPWGQPVWHPLDGRHYYGVFWEGMPDFDLENPEVTAELHDIARFWLEEVGVDGFRVDAARHLVEEGDDQEDTPASIEWLRGLNTVTEAIAADSLLLGEVWSPSVIVGQYVPEGVDLAFEFELAEAIILAVEAGTTSGILPVLERIADIYPPGQFAPFLTNHDQVRVMNRLFSEERAAAAASILLTLPGVPFLYYGEEIGMRGNKPDPRIRTPMQWTDTAPGFGFTTAAEPWQPFQADAADVNVAAQVDTAGSLLDTYRSLISVRTRSPALKYGTVRPVETATGSVLSYLRSIGDDHVLVVVNLGRGATALTDLDLRDGPLAAPVTVTPLLGRVEADPVIDVAGGFTGYRPVAELAPYEVLILAISGN